MLKKITTISTVIVMAMFASIGCEQIDNEPEPSEDLWAEEDVYDDWTQGDGVLSDSVTPGASQYRYIRIRDGFSEQLVDCNGFNPGADIDAVGVMAPDAGETELQVQGYCETVTHTSAETLGRSSCPDKDPSADELHQATGAPDTCPGSFEEPDCPGWAGDTYFQLNGGEIVCDLGDTVRVYAGDTIVVYEVFNPDKIEETAEPWTLYIGTANDGSAAWDEVGEGLGAGAVVVPGGENMF